MGGGLGSAVLAQTRMEVLLTLRRGENVLITIIVPVVLLFFFTSMNIVTGGINFILPGMLALSVISTSMVSLGIATAYERHYGVLKRLGGTPLPRAGLIAAKASSVLLIEALQVVLLGAIALAFGWRPGPDAVAALGVLILGTAAFTGIGLAMAGGLRAEATLAAANGLYLLLLLLSDIVLPISHLPGFVRDLARLLPSTALSEALRGLLAPSPSLSVLNLALLIVWAVLALGVAASTFQWE